MQTPVSRQIIEAAASASDEDVAALSRMLRSGSSLDAASVRAALADLQTALQIVRIRRAHLKIRLSTLESAQAYAPGQSPAAPRTVAYF